ncbi:MAG: hypothetical protein RL732_1219 [Bacteroidota bacterium]
MLFCLRQGSAQTLVAGFSSSTIGGGWELPVGVAFSKTGDQLFVWEKAGKVFLNHWNSVTKTYDKQTTPVIDISPEVGNWRDMGMLGFALDPKFEMNGYIYLMYCVDRHYLMNFGTPNYNIAADDYYTATIGRITRYKTYTNAFGHLVADLDSRKILLGETKSTGFPILFDSHGVGSLAFAMDGTLLASCGDGSSYVLADIGNDPATYYEQALIDSIIRPNENVGVLRSQMLTSLNGKIIRIDPATGDGVSSNPFYESGAPRSAKSRVWAMGFRNPFRFSIKPNSGSVDPAIGDVGELYVGDVGFNSFEEVTVVKAPGSNCGWPLYEGVIFDDDFGNVTVENKDEPNPLFGTGGCTQQYFTFRQLLKQANPTNNNIIYNPCNPTVPITSKNNNRFIHRPPLLDWQHGAENSRVGIFSGDTLVAAVIGTPESKVIGTPFRGNASTGSLWYTGSMFPPSYKNTLFICDFGANWIKNLKVEYTDKLKQVSTFATDFQGIVQMVENPMDGSIFCVDIGAQAIKKISYVSNQPPVAKITADKVYGPAPLTENFSSNDSYDPEGFPLTYSWDFGDGTAPSTVASPSHVFQVSGGKPQKFTVKLTVTDKELSAMTDSIVISVNNTPPKVLITSLPRNSFYSVGPDTSYSLLASVSDLEHPADQLSYRWQTILRHNNHEHPGPVDTNKSTSVVISRIGCNGEPFHWIVKLAVTDGAGLTTYDSVKLYPGCATSVPQITTQPQSVSVCEGTTIIFQTGISEYYILPVQWQTSVDDGITWTSITGATSTTLKVSAALSESGRLFRSVWTNNKGTSYSNVAVLGVKSIPAAPTGSNVLKYCFAADVADLVASGSMIKWYGTSTGGSALGSDQLISSGVQYYATQTVNGCESTQRLPVSVLVNNAEAPSIVLDGTHSSGTPFSYNWSLVSGPNIPLIDSPTAALTTVRKLVRGNYIFRLTLDGGQSVSDVIVMVNNNDSPFVARAGYDRSMLLPNTIAKLDGSASSGKIRSYSWKKVNGPNTPSLTSPVAASTYVTGLVAGIYDFELTLTDSSMLIKKDTVRLTVLPESNTGTKPVIDQFHTASGSIGSVVNNLNVPATGSLLVLSVAQSNQPFSVFNGSQARQPDPALLYNDVSPIELGMRFRSFDDGFITGVRFFKAVGDYGTHIGELYTADGIRLAQATFTNETSSGWQTVYFSQPVLISKYTTYIVAYFSEKGNYTAYPNFFNNSVIEPPLTGLADGIDGSNGLYSYTATPSAPRNSYNKTNYWVDVLFSKADAVVSSNPPLTWIKKADAGALAGSGSAEIYAALFPRGGSITVTTDWGKGPLSTALYSLSGFDNQLNGKDSSSLNQTIAALSLPNKRTNSLFIGVAADRNAVNGSSRVYRDSTLETYYERVDSAYTAYHFRKPTGALGNYVAGLSAPTGMSAGTALFEVMGQLKIPLLADAGYNQQSILSIAPAGESVQNFCDSASLRSMKVTGNAVQWYPTLTGTQPLTFSTALQDGSRYFATQVLNGCESKERLSVDVNVTPTPPKPLISTKDNCDSSYTLSVAPGGSLLWSTADTGSSIIVRTSDSFYVARTIKGCSSPRSGVAVAPVLLVLNATAQQPLCVDDKGSVVLQATGGYGTYLFNNTPTQELAAGTYLYRVTDGHNCIREQTVVIGVDKTYWTGNIDSDWHNPLNWSTGKVPGSTTHVIVPRTTNLCIITKADAAAASLQTVQGGAVKIENSRKIYLSGKCLNLPSIQ